MYAYMYAKKKRVKSKAATADATSNAIKKDGVAFPHTLAEYRKRFFRWAARKNIHHTLAQHVAIYWELFYWIPIPQSVSNCEWFRDDLRRHYGPSEWNEIVADNHWPNAVHATLTTDDGDQQPTGTNCSNKQSIRKKKLFPPFYSSYVN